MDGASQWAQPKTDLDSSDRGSVPFHFCTFIKSFVMTFSLTRSRACRFNKVIFSQSILNIEQNLFLCTCIVISSYVLVLFRTFS